MPTFSATARANCPSSRGFEERELSDLGRFAALVDNFDIRMNLPSHILAAILGALPPFHGEESLLTGLVLELRGRGSDSLDY